MPNFTVEFKLFYPDRGVNHQLVMIDLKSQSEEEAFEEAREAIEEFTDKTVYSERFTMLYGDSGMCFSRFNVSSGHLSTSSSYSNILSAEIGQAKIYDFIPKREE